MAALRLLSYISLLSQQGILCTLPQCISILWPFLIWPASYLAYIIKLYPTWSPWFYKFFGPCHQIFKQQPESSFQNKSQKMSSVSPNPVVVFHSTQSYSQCPFLHSLFCDLPPWPAAWPHLLFSLLLTLLQPHWPAYHCAITRGSLSYQGLYTGIPLPGMFFLQISVHMANSLTTFGLYSNIISSEVCPVPPNYHLTLPTVLGLL